MYLLERGTPKRKNTTVGSTRKNSVGEVLTPRGDNRPLVKGTPYALCLIQYTAGFFKRRRGVDGWLYLYPSLRHGEKKKHASVVLLGG